MAAKQDRPPRILVVEDESKTASTVALYLRHAGMEVGLAHDGETGLEMAESGGFDLAILDIMLPKRSGLEICRSLRQGSKLPVIMLTAKTTEQDRIDGLDLGADDYVPKPFSPRELVSRVKAVLRRSGLAGMAADVVIRRGDLVVDVSSREVVVDGNLVELTPVEFDLLRTLMEKPGHVWTRETLIESVPGRAPDVSDRTIDAHIKNLRKKIESDRSNPRYVKTVHGVGYRFVGTE